ncbi:MAG: hypothetical protein IPM36_04425 [Lewinellaceae bacterium]|nr:hypothetical protein [Lewinellaceae bacterium]
MRDELKIAARDFFTDCKAALGTVARDEFRLLRTNTDDLGMTHYRYQQYYRGYRIEGALYTLHEQQGRVARLMAAFCLPSRRKNRRLPWRRKKRFNTPWN